MAANYTDRDYWLGIAPTKTFGENPGTASGAYDWLQLSCPMLNLLGATETVIPERIIQTRQHHEDDAFTHTKGVPYEVSIPAHDMVLNNLDLFLMSLFQNITETGGTSPYELEFEPHASEPDFSGDAGYLLHVGAVHLISNKGWLASAGICKSVTLVYSTDNAGKRMHASAELLMQDVVRLDDPYNTTKTRDAAGFAYITDLKGTNSYVKIDSQAVHLNSLEITISNNAEYVGYDSKGRPESFHIPEWTVNGTIRVKRNDTTDAFISSWAAGSKVPLDLLDQSTGMFGSTGDFRIRTEMLLETPTKEGDKEEIWSFPFVGLKTDSLPCCKIDRVSNFKMTDLFTGS
jgi:hypothetical protein